MLLEALRRKVAPHVASVLAAKDMAALLGNPDGLRSADHPGRVIITSLHDMALVGLLGDDEKAWEAARRVLISGAISQGTPEIVVFAYDLLQTRLSAADQRLMSAAGVERLREFLKRAGPVHLLGAGGNHVLTYLLYALLWLLAIDGDPGTPALDAERATLLRGFEAGLYSALGEGGYPAEDMGYGTMMTERLVLAATCLRRAGLCDAYGKSPRLARSGQAILHFVQPWGGFLSNTGDHGDGFREREQALPHLARYNNDPTLMWLMGTIDSSGLDADQRGNRDMTSRVITLAPGFEVPINAMSLISLPDAPLPMHPRQADVPTAFRDSDRGIVSFRSGWNDDATFVYFDGSQRPTGAQGHAHDSGGHFSLTALGEYFAVGPGRYGIEQDQHNVMLIDGKSGRTTNGEWGASPHQGRLIAYRPDPLCDYAAADNTPQANCHWSVRHLGLVKGDIPVGRGIKGPGQDGNPTGLETLGYVWTVDDVNAADDYRQFWWTLWSEPGNKIEMDGDHALIHGRRHGGTLHVHFAIPSPDSYPKPHTLELSQDMPNTSSYKYVSRKQQEISAFNTVHHAVYFRPRLTAKLSGWNGNLMAVMIPQKQGEPVPTIESVPTVMGALAMRLTFEHFKDTIIWAYTHQLLEADGIRGRGQWTVVRRARADGRVLAHAIHQADWLEIDGKSFPTEPSAHS